MLRFVLYFGNFSAACCGTFIIGSRSRAHPECRNIDFSMFEDQDACGLFVRQEHAPDTD